MLHFALSSEDCKGEAKLLICYATLRSIATQCMGVPQYHKASGYSDIKAALRCSSATCFAHKPLNAPLRSFVHGLQGRSQAFEVLRNDLEYPLRKAWKYKLRNAWEYKPRNAWEYQQYRKASGYSGIKAALRCPSATHLAHKPLDASLRSFVRGLQERRKAFDALRNDWEYPLCNAWEYKLRNA